MGQERTLATRVARSFLYSGVGGLLAKLLFLGAIFVVLELISVEDFGVANIVLAIFAITESINELGLGVALVQRKHVSREDTDSLFWLSLGLSTILYLGFFFAAPLIASFYRHEALTDLLRVHGLVLILFSLHFVPRNLMVKDLHFGRLTAVDLVSLTSSAALMIGLAYAGFGPWSLIVGDVASRAMQAVMCQILRPYWPGWRMNLKGIRDMVSFGMYATGARLLYNFRTNVDYLIVGKVFGAEVLGLYTLAYRVVFDVIKTTTALTNRVAFPAFSKLQTDLVRLRKYFFTIARASMSLIGVLLIIVAVYLDWALVVLGYEKWMGAVPYARVFAILGFVRAVSPLIPQLLNAKGLARLNFYYSLASTMVLPAAFLIGAQFGVMGVVWSWVICYPLLVLIQVRFGAQVLETNSVWFTIRLMSGLQILLPVGLAAFGLRWLLADAYLDHPLGITIGAIGATVLGGMVAVLLRERQIIALVLAKRRQQGPAADARKGESS